MQQLQMEPREATIGSEEFYLPNHSTSSRLVHRSIGENKDGLALRRRVAAECKARAARSRFLADGLFSDPAWDILIELFAAELEGRALTVSAVGHSACVPMTTALRWLNALGERRLIERADDPNDARRSFVRLSDAGSDAMRSYFENLLTVHQMFSLRTPICPSCQS